MVQYETRSPAMSFAETQPFYNKLYRYVVRQHNILLWPNISRYMTCPAMAMLAAMVTIPRWANRLFVNNPTATAILLFFIAADVGTSVAAHTRFSEIAEG